MNTKKEKQIPLEDILIARYMTERQPLSENMLEVMAALYKRQADIISYLRDNGATDLPPHTKYRFQKYRSAKRPSQQQLYPRAPDN